MGEDRTPRHAGYRPTWRCETCGARFDEPPEECRACGGESFQAIEQWSG